MSGDDGVAQAFDGERPFDGAGDEGVAEHVDRGPSAEELIDRRRAAEHLEEVPEQMPEDLPTMFVLFGVEPRPTV